MRMNFPCSTTPLDPKTIKSVFSWRTEQKKKKYKIERQQEQHCCYKSGKKNAGKQRGKLRILLFTTKSFSFHIPPQPFSNPVISFAAVDATLLLSMYQQWQSEWCFVCTVSATEKTNLLNKKTIHTLDSNLQRKTIFHNKLAGLLV